MRIPSLSHLSSPAVLTGLIRAAADERTSTAILLAYIGEAAERRLYAAEGYDSMLSYCIGELRMSRDAARKRIHAAHAARQFGAIYDAVADGRLHLSAVVMLAPRLTPQNADELLASATHKTKEEIELLIAHRFPAPDLPTQERPVNPPTSNGSLLETACAPGRTEESVFVQPTDPPARVVPLAPERFGLQCRAPVHRGPGHLRQAAVRETTSGREGGNRGSGDRTRSCARRLDRAAGEAEVRGDFPPSVAPASEP
jgi:hypothetical protein